MNVGGCQAAVAVPSAVSSRPPTNNAAPSAPDNIMAFGRRPWTNDTRLTQRSTHTFVTYEFRICLDASSTSARSR